MKKQVIVITFNGDSCNINNKPTNGIILSGLSMRRNV